MFRKTMMKILLPLIGLVAQACPTFAKPVGLFELSPLRAAMGQWDINGEMSFSELMNVSVTGHHYTNGEDQSVGVLQDDAIAIAAVFYPKIQDLEWFFLGPKLEYQKLQVSFAEELPRRTYARVLGVEENHWTSGIDRINGGAIFGWRLESDGVWTVSLSGEVMSNLSETVKAAEINERNSDEPSSEKSVDRFTKQFSLRVGLAIH